MVVYQTPRLDRKPFIQIDLDMTEEDLIFFFRGDLALVKTKCKKAKPYKTLRVSHRKAKAKEARCCSSWVYGMVFVVLFSARARFLLLQQGKEGGKHTERN